MKLTVVAILMVFSFSSIAFTPVNVKCLQDAKKRGLKMEDAYQSCSVSSESSFAKKKK